MKILHYVSDPKIARINSLKGLFKIFSKFHNWFGWVACIIALYVGYTTYPNECVSVGVCRVWLLHYQKPTETHTHKRTYIVSTSYIRLPFYMRPVCYNWDIKLEIGSAPSLKIWLFSWSIYLQRYAIIIEYYLRRCRLGHL